MLKKIKPYILPYAVGIAIPISVGLLSAFLTMGNMDIYTRINTPPLAPPGFIFPIVWTLLYILMGISSAMVYINRFNDILSATVGLKYYAISLLFNFGWSLIFFNSGAFLIAFIWLIFLLYFIVKSVLKYFKVKKLAALLQIPYIIWVVFAGYLNLSITLLN